MEIEWVRQYCLSLAHTTEVVQWGDDLVFKVAGKMYAVMPLEPAPAWLSFKCTDEEFASLVDQPGVIPAAYLARAKWVSLQNEAALPLPEVKRLLRQSYDLVVARLPKKTRVALGRKGAAVSKARKR